MLRRQRTFFLTANQYEPVMLEYTGVVSGQLRYRFKSYDDATRFIIRYRQSQNGGTSWSSWTDSQENVISRGTDGYCAFYFAAVSGLMYEVCVIMTGDEKDPSVPSNIVTTIYPSEPVQAPPVINGYAFYYNGKPVPAIQPLEIPTGVSSWLVWYREFGNTDWIGVATVNGGVYCFLDTNFILPGHTYQFIIAWYDSANNKIISDISNVATIELPSADIGYLLPPKQLQTIYYGEYNGGYYNRLLVQRGDMRATSVSIEYKRSSVGTWTPFSSDFVFSEHGITDDTKTYWIGISMGTDLPIAGEVWQYRLKNKAGGLTTSEYSDLFTITMPSVLPKLSSPAITLQQSGHSVVVGLSEVTDSVGYKIERRSSSESNWTVIQASLVPSTRTYTDSSTSYGNTYFYRVTALGDNITYQNSDPTTDSISVTQYVVLDAPVIDSVTESGINVVVAISNLNTPNIDKVVLEMSENNGSWTVVASEYPASQSDTSISITVAGEKILEGGDLRFRARCTPAGQAIDPSPYSSIASITIDEREWLLRWTGSTWDYCTSVTGGWYNPAFTDSDGTHAGNLVATDLGSGTLRISGPNNTSGQGYWTNRTGLTTNNAPLSSKYKKVIMLGTLVKQTEGQDYHAWFGTAWDYTFAGGWNMDHGRGTKVIAGSDSGRGAAGSRTDPNVNACGSYTYAPRDGAHVYLYFANGYADIKGIYATKR